MCVARRISALWHISAASPPAGHGESGFPPVSGALGQPHPVAIISAERTQGLLSSTDPLASHGTLQDTHNHTHHEIQVLTSWIT